MSDVCGLKKLIDSCPCDLGPMVKRGEDDKLDNLADKMSTEGLSGGEFMEFMHRLNEQDPSRGLPRESEGMYE